MTSCPNLHVLKTSSDGRSASAHLLSFLSSRRDKVFEGVDVEGVKIEPIKILITDLSRYSDEELARLKELAEEVLDLDFLSFWEVEI